ncbi:sensor histidine kinase [Alteromonas sp. AMM-1]|uniref:sensor histidine kinase n=1 Tax=Alteromonas sp. AMM-1 TaxID=3394233 RepID=UPI0039A48BC7
MTSKHNEQAALIERIQLQQEELKRRLDEEQINLRELARRLWTQQESEKARLSRELHDGVGQLLTGLTRRLQGIASNQPEFTELYDIAEMALADVRQLSRMMSPTILDDLGLKPALKWLCRNLFEAEGIQYACDINLKGDIPKVQAILVFRIAQEALVNALKHSRADTITVNLAQHHQVLRLDVIDNGVGFDVENIERGIGMSSMLDRASAFDAELTFQARPHQGTHITLTVAL